MKFAQLEKHDNLVNFGSLMFLYGFIETNELSINHSLDLSLWFKAFSSWIKTARKTVISEERHCFESSRHLQNIQRRRLDTKASSRFKSMVLKTMI